jgi:hypothetical protein
LIASPNFDCQTILFQIVDAIDSLRFFLGRRQRWQKHRREDGEDGDDDEKHDEGESAGFGFHAGIIAPLIFHFKQLSLARGGWILARWRQFWFAGKTRFLLYLFGKAVWLPNKSILSKTNKFYL